MNCCLPCDPCDFNMASIINQMLEHIKDENIHLSEDDREKLESCGSSEGYGADYVTTDSLENYYTKTECDATFLKKDHNFDFIPHSTFIATIGLLRSEIEGSKIDIGELDDRYLAKTLFLGTIASLATKSELNKYATKDYVDDRVGSGDGYSYVDSFKLNDDNKLVLTQKGAPSDKSEFKVTLPTGSTTNVTWSYTESNEVKNASTRYPIGTIEINNRKETLYAKDVVGTGGGSGDGDTKTRVDVMFKVGDAEPTTPTNTSYDFITESYSNLGGWSMFKPSTGKTWMSIVTSYSNKTHSTWSKPTCITVSDPVYNDAMLFRIVRIYKYEAVDAGAPNTPAKGLGSYNFTTDTLTPPPGWSVTKPTSNNETDILWECTGVVYETSSLNTWFDPVPLNGKVTEIFDLTKTKVVVIYKKSTSKPGTPVGGSYDFETNTFSTTGLTAGWNIIPLSGEDAWYSIKAFHNKADNTSVWSEPQPMATANVDISAIQYSVLAQKIMLEGDYVKAIAREIDIESLDYSVLAEKIALNGNLVKALANEIVLDADQIEILAPGVALNLSEDLINLISENVNITGQLNSLNIVVGGGSSVFNKDGSGYVANGAITWDKNGNTSNVKVEAQVLDKYTPFILTQNNKTIELGLGCKYILFDNGTLNSDTIHIDYLNPDGSEDTFVYESEDVWLVKNEYLDCSIYNATNRTLTVAIGRQVAIYSGFGENNKKPQSFKLRSGEIIEFICRFIGENHDVNNQDSLIALYVKNMSNMIYNNKTNSISIATVQYNNNVILYNFSTDGTSISSHSKYINDYMAERCDISFPDSGSIAGLFISVTHNDLFDIDRFIPSLQTDVPGTNMFIPILNASYAEHSGYDHIYSYVFYNLSTGNYVQNWNEMTADIDEYRNNVISCKFSLTYCSY